VVFIGTFEHSIDDKGRLAIPVRFRSELADGVYVTRGIEKCLMVLTAEHWQRLVDGMSSLPMLQNDARRLQRHFFSGAAPLQPDRLGRVLIPQFLREYAQLSSEVVVVGVMNRVEIWDRHAWTAERDEVESLSQELAEHLSSNNLL
jgi:MraZ protein